MTGAGYLHRAYLNTLVEKWFSKLGWLDLQTSFPEQEVKIVTQPVKVFGSLRQSNYVYDTDLYYATVNNSHQSLPNYAYLLSKHT